MIEIWAYNIETILAEKVETILRRSVHNTRPRDFYDEYIFMRTKRQAINKEIFTTALNATAQKRMSLAALRDKDKILLTIEADLVMRQRWDRYSKENYYANGIDFAQVMEALIEIVN
jgi:predicted nucleotidyltransferase component of viral defense system